MAKNQNQRLRKAAAKASKRKQVVAQKRREASATGGDSTTREIISATQFPYKTCLMPEELFTTGIGWVVVSRDMPSGSAATCLFLVDVWCMGVKNCMFRLCDPEEFEGVVQSAGMGQTMKRAEPALARKLLHDAAAYADSIGIPSHADYASCVRIFGDTPMSDDVFTFGKDGKPMFVNGPNISLSRSRRIIDMLTRKLGPKGFEYIIGEPDLDGAFDGDEDEFDDDGDAEEGEVLEGEVLPPPR